MEGFFDIALQLCEGLGVTLLLFVLTVIFSIPLGLLCSLGSRSKNIVVRGIINVYVLIMRGTPLLLQIIFLFYGLGFAGVKLPRELSALLSLVLNYTAYFSEIFRGGIQSMDKGQYEAAGVLGLTKRQTFMRIILPQVFKRVMPSIGNEVINLVKDTALVSWLAINDILKIAQGIMVASGTVTALIVAMAFYLIINAVVTIIMRKIEGRFNYYR